MNTNSYFYLHGFASSPHSVKAQYLKDKWESCNINCSIPDLNQDDFSNLTLTRQIEQTASLFRDQPLTIIGSSLGGLTAAWLGEKYSQVQQLILLAPAFGFLSSWLERLGGEEVKKWQETGSLLVYHYGYQKMMPINYTFVEDTRQYQDQALQRSVPTLILHGKYDEVIPIEYSRAYVNERPWVKLVELESDHGLTDCLPEIWQEIKDFCQFTKCKISVQ